jgi:hypothetical protein
MIKEQRFLLAIFNSVCHEQNVDNEIGKKVQELKK